MWQAGKDIEFYPPIKVCVNDMTRKKGVCYWCLVYLVHPEACYKEMLKLYM
ncbi:predicted protein [Botrytis cinerea T4]|uniref:Uncharacterized protein n=1 Tax=Botryotinia fuckeliana (strain T4) TaxID=999810 RepID=G2YQH5_BOTF4|nr:predicted protein [Botrytis cinerea T4]